MLNKIKLLASILVVCNTAAFAAPHTEIRSVELADIIKELMGAKVADAPNNYPEMKKIFGKLQRATSEDLNPNPDESFPGDEGDYYAIYHGRINLLSKGKPIATDLLEDDASWKVWVAGSKFEVTDVWFEAENAAKGSAKAGSEYFRSKGLTLEAIDCDREPDSGGEGATYKVSFLKRKPISLSIGTMSGSRGKHYSYHISFSEVKASALPQDAKIGSCEVD